MACCGFEVAGFRISSSWGPGATQALSVETRALCSGQSAVDCGTKVHAGVADTDTAHQQHYKMQPRSELVTSFPAARTSLASARAAPSSCTLGVHTCRAPPTLHGTFQGSQHDHMPASLRDSMRPWSSSLGDIKYRIKTAVQPASSGERHEAAAPTAPGHGK